MSGRFTHHECFWFSVIFGVGLTLTGIFKWGVDLFVILITALSALGLYCILRWGFTRQAGD